MKIGAVMFFTTDSMRPAPLARLLEERGFESLWVPEHTHIPSSRKTDYPAGGGLIRPYYDIMDPFLVLNAAATATTRLKVGTGIALVIQRDPIITAKMVATIDQLSEGRFLFGVGNGWNQDEIENHGTDFKSPPQARPRAHRGDEDDLGERRAGVSRRARQVRQDEDVAQAVPETAPADHRRRPLRLCRQARHPLRRRLDPARRLAGVRGHRRHLRPSARWRPTPDAIPRACRSACFACPTISSA